MEERAIPKVQSVKKMKEIMTTYYIEAKTAREAGRQVAWITSGGPVELLVNMDIIPVYPENHGAMIGAAKMGVALCEAAEGLGYSPDLCSYARADIACARESGGPIGGLPRPDMLICGNNICGSVLKWYEVQARYFDVPLFIFDTPFCHEEFTHEARKYVRAQTDELIVFLEGVTGRAFDYDRLREVGVLSVEAQRLWQAVLDLSSSRPAPISAFDAFFHLALMVTLRGTQIAVDYYRSLLAELEQRVAARIGAIPQETYRLLWDNLPVWYKTKWLAEKFSSHEACLVADTYTSAWCGSLKYIDPDNFLDSLAEAYSRIYLNIGIDQMASEVIAMIDKYKVDGLIMHSNRSCKPYSFGQYDLRRVVREKRDLPTLIIEADMLDERNFSAAQVETRIEAFIELLAGGNKNHPSHDYSPQGL